MIPNPLYLFANFSKVIHWFTILAVLWAATTPAFAQQKTGVIDWSGETILRQNPGERFQLFFPQIVADAYGMVHVFWPEGPLIYYMRKNNAGWTQPLDLVYLPGKNIQFVSAAVDQDGVLHLVWEAFGNLYYQSAPAWQAEFVKKWSDARIIGHVGLINTPLRIGVDPDNSLHILFADWAGEKGKTLAGNVYQIFSKDGGKTWSNYIQISNISNGDLATDPRMAFDDRGQMHIVWGQMSPDNGMQRGVYYARLSIADQVVNHLQPIALRDENYKWIMAINIAVGNGGMIYTIWTCGKEQARRCQSYSKDGGDNWSSPKPAFGDLLGLSGWDALFVDGADNVYWMGVLRYPQAMYYSVAEGEGFREPPLIASQEPHMKLGENVMVSVGLGNEIHAVVNLSDKIVYMSGTTDAAKLPALPLPKQGAQVEMMPTLTAVRAHQLTPTQTVPISPELQTAPVIDLNASRQVLTVSFLAVIVTLSVSLGAVSLFRRIWK